MYYCVCSCVVAKQEWITIKLGNSGLLKLLQLEREALSCGSRKSWEIEG